MTIKVHRSYTENNDYISRKVAMDIVNDAKENFAAAFEGIRRLPSVKVHPLRHRRWLMVNEYCNHSNEFFCSECQTSIIFDHYIRYCDHNYCPNCGCRMDAVD